jgi:hypothetical protein
VSHCITTTFRVEEKAIVLVPGAQHKCGEQDVRHKRHQRNVQVGGVQVVLRASSTRSCGNHQWRIGVRQQRGGGTYLGRQILFLAVGRLCDASRPRLNDELGVNGKLGRVYKLS